MRTAKRILAEFMTVIMVLQACSPTVAAVAAGWQNISSEIAAASAEASDAAESGETNGDAANGSGASDAGAAGGGAQDGAAKDDAATGDTSDSATGSDFAGDQTESDDTAGDAAADDAEQDADDAASEDVAAQADATINTLDELVRLLEANGAESIECKDDNSGIKSLDVKLSAAFTILSNADASLYYDAQIKSIITGDAKLTETAKNGAKNDMSFQGFGSDEHPFEGRIYRSLNGVDSPVELTANRTVFNNLKLTDQNKTVKIKWIGATTYSAPMVATKVSGGGKTLNAVVNIANPVGTDGTDTTSALTAPLLGEAMGDLTTEVTYGPAGSLEKLNVNAAGNIGLLANTVKSGTFTVGSVKFPDSLAAGGVVKTSSGNAGLLVGTVEDGATLNVGTLNVPAATVQSASGSAGGVVGLVGSNTGAAVNVTEALDLHMLTVKGTTASGGFIGKATVLTLGADNKQIRCPLNIGDENSACSGGVIGDVSFAQGFIVKPNMFDLGNLVTLGASQRAGALFGMADISNGDIVVQGGTYKSKLALPEDVSVNGSYGGLVGKVFATKTDDDGALRAFVVQKDADKKTCSIEFELAGKLSDTGGVVGYVGDNADSNSQPVNSQPVAVVLDGVTVTCKGVASARTDAGKFGGAVGVIDTRSVLDVRDFALTSDNAIGGAANNRAAGIAGSARNAVIKFSGITNLSGASFAENATTGQLVYENNNALIFAAGDGSNGNVTDEDATGWTYRRSNKASKTDDIATYGEVIRLGDKFITLDPSTHKLTLPASLALTNGAYALTTAEDFAKLAITWQTNGYYSMVEGVAENNLNGLQSSTITVNNTIDLKGTGLTGFTQDRAGDSQVFSGTLNGGGTNGNGTINLAVGEPYGKRGEAVLDGNDTSNGNGKIYRHGRLGLFAAVNGATISNVTIAGSMKFDNGSAIDAGSLAGGIVGNLSLSSVTCKTNIACDDTFANDVNIGGIAGSVSAAATVAFKGNSKAQTTITAAGSLNGNSRIGGAIGYVSDCASTFNVTGLEVAGSIETGDCAGGKIAQVGGLIGCIAQSTYNAGTIANSADKHVNISGLSFNSFKMNVGRNGDALNGAGGLLGYSWGNAIVTIGDAAANTSGSTYALKTTNNTTVAASDSTEVGGLVYAASGHWIINNYAIDLSGTTINAGAAQTLGVLVCRGCKVDNKTTYGVENYIGLYLEDKACWETAYRVPSGEGAIVAPGVTSFDEWVGSGVKPSKSSKLMDAGCNAVVSLHTRNDKLDMDGDATNGNSYQNRSTFGQSHKTNGNTRYFYNLDGAYDRCEGGFSGGQINTADKLLLWSAFCYAPAGIRSTIVPDGTTGLDGSITITGTIDLAGYSYYPTQPIGEVTVNNAVITFYYSKIKAEQNGNKLNSDATQHENMHCGLFQTVADGDLTVSNVTLGGTVGPVINDGKSSTDAIGAGGSSSGALVCRYVCGSSDGSGTKIRKISIDDLTLNNLIVDGANSATDANAYMPLLINEMQKYVSLNAKNIKTTGYTSGTKAATSLFGKLGVGSEADQVTAKFERISLPSQNSNTIFTHASLLESFGYKSTGTGSADYTFTKAEANAGMVTYGSEIDAENKEYSGKQLWYYDEATYGAVSGYVTVDGKKDDDVRPWFGDYLPYVYKGKATEDGVQYHEIKVNQRIPKLVEGCGTYGDPYAVKDAAEMNAIANYINNSVALDGWEVTIAADQSRLCERRNKTKTDSARTDNEVVYVYKQNNPSESKWEKKVDDTTDPSQTLSDETMHRYVQSAYYSIEPAEGNKIGSVRPRLT